MGNKREWKVVVEFVPFESERERDEAYRNWARLFLKAKKAELESKQTTQKEDCHEEMSEAGG